MDREEVLGGMLVVLTGHLFFLLGAYMYLFEHNNFFEQAAILFVMAVSSLMIIGGFLNIITAVLNIVILAILVPFFLSAKADYNLSISCKIYDKLKKKCVEYNNTMEKIYISLERPASFYDDFYCYIKPMKSSYIEKIDVNCYPQNDEVLVEIPVKENLFRESKRWRLHVNAEKGNIEEEAAFTILFEPIIDEKTKKL